MKLKVLLLAITCLILSVMPATAQEAELGDTDGYVFVVSNWVGTSWGSIYYSNGFDVPYKTGLYGAQPVLVGDTIYAIEYLSEATPDGKVPITVPIKYDIKTGAKKELGKRSSATNANSAWRIIDAHPNGLYLLGSGTGGFTIFNANGGSVRKVSASMKAAGFFTSVCFTADGKKVFYCMDGKAYWQAINSSTKNVINKTGYNMFAMPNYDGTKAVVGARVEGLDKCYYWSRGTLTTINIPKLEIIQGVDMDKGGDCIVVGNCGGQNYSIYYIESATAMPMNLTPGITNFPSRWYADIKDGDILYGWGNRVCYVSSGMYEYVIGQYGSLVQMTSWDKR